MTPAVLAIPNGLFRLQSHLKYILCPLSTSAIKAFSSSLALDTEETPAMQALRDIPYPSTSPDPSIFEAWSNEYDGVRLPRARRSTGSVTFSRSANEGHNASRVLKQLARDGKFEEAEEIRQELVAMNIPIRPSSVYSRVARNILRRRPWPPNRTEMFVNWLYLLPNFTQDHYTTRVADIKSALLFDSNRLDLESVARFGIILSAKGYIRIVGASVVACLTRYAHPDTSSRILHEMVAADDDYKRDKLGVTGDTRSKDTAKRLWSISVRTQCNAGRPGVALQMAKRAHERGIHLTQYSYQYLLGKLEASGLDDLAAEVRDFPGCESLDVAKRRLVIEEVSARESISLYKNKFVNRSLALALLRHSSRSGSSACATDIVPYFDLYKTDHRGGGAVNWLRSRAYRISFTAVSTVLLAELLHHHRRGQFKHVLWVFERFFHVVAVPSENVTHQLWKRHHYPPLMHLQHWDLPTRITKTTFNLPSRLWPSVHHTALVWSALVHLCDTEDELFALYDRLLQHSPRSEKSALALAQHQHHSHRHQHHRHRSHGETVLPVTAPADRHDAAHFRPFLIAFTLLHGAQYGLRVLDDMQDRGVAPSAQLLSTAAGLQARHGEPVIALRMLDVMRSLLERGEQQGENQEEGAKTQRQHLLLGAYTSVMRGFADRRELTHARQVADMLVEQLEYVEGGNAHGGDGDGGNARTDAVLQFLRRLEVDGPRARPEPVDDVSQEQRHLYRFLKKRNPEVRLPSLLFSSLHPHSLRGGWRAPGVLLCVLALELTGCLLLVLCAGNQDAEHGPCCELTRNRSTRHASTSLLLIKAGSIISTKRTGDNCANDSLGFTSCIIRKRAGSLAWRHKFSLPTLLCLGRGLGRGQINDWGGRHMCKLNVYSTAFN